MERVMGIEPTYPAWKAGVLPMNYTRTCDFKSIAKTEWFVNTFLEKSTHKPHFFSIFSIIGEFYYLRIWL